MVNEQFESIVRRVEFDETDWSTDRLPFPQIPCPTCAGTVYTHHIDEMPMRSVIGYRDENGETINLLDCGHIAVD